MYPISDLTAFCKRTTGDVPPKLVGASTSVVGSKMYLYGGRLVAERRMVSDIYVFDLETFNWEKLTQNPEDDIPQARYFHSTDTWSNHLVVFGGMAIQPQSDNPEDLCVLNDVRFFDLSTGRWLPASVTTGFPPTSPLVPKARYAHLSSVTANRLFVIGGQDLNNVWLDDIHIYDLVSNQWVHRRDYPRHCGTYRSVAVTSDKRVRIPQQEQRQPSKLGAAGTRFNVDSTAPSVPNVTQPDSYVHLPYSAEPTDEHPSEIYLFSNYNFTDVQRELEVLTPLPGSDFAVTDKSANMTGNFFPPGLRFPTGAVLGTTFIVAGTFLSQTYQSFSIWALDLITMTWSRIDPGSTLSGTSGSWFRSCLWPEESKFFIFGNRHGSLVEDYNRRLLSWEHVICIDLEAFGIYQPPPLALDIPKQELGLAALEEGVLADFEIVCDDGRRIKCSRKVLEDRWPWFKEQRRLFLQAATRALETIPVVPGSSSALPDVQAASDQDEPRPDPRLTPRSFQLSEPFPITMALLQYFYSMSLITPLQHAPAVLSQLLLLSSTYELTHLQSLVKHAMHRALTFATSVGIYGVSTLCNCRSLQIRALRVVMAYSQKRPAGRARVDRDHPGGGRGGESGRGDDGSEYGMDRQSGVRPRGMSDASYMRGASDMSMNGATRGYANGPEELGVTPETDQAIRALAYSLQMALRKSGSSVLTAKSSSSSLSSMPAPTSLPNTQPRRPSRNPVRPKTAPSSLQRRDSVASVVSLNTDQDIRALVEILSPTIEVDEASDEGHYLDIRPKSSSSSSGGQSIRDRDSHGSAYTSNTGSLRTSSHDSWHTPNTDYRQFEEFRDSTYLASLSSFPTFPLPYPLSEKQLSRLSDVPSLTSSDSYTLSTPSLSRASSFQHPVTSPPLTPSTSSNLPTPIEPLSESGLGITQEQRHTDEAINFGINSVEPIDHEFKAVHRAHSPTLGGKESFDSHTTWEPRGLRDLAKLRLHRDSTSDTITPDTRSLDSEKTSATGSSGATSHLPAPHTPSQKSGGGAFSRFFSKNKSQDHSIDHESSHLDMKINKADEKARKKQLAKEHTERLAQELKEKANARRIAKEVMSSTSSGQRKGTWEESSGMYKGLGGL